MRQTHREFKRMTTDGEMGPPKVAPSKATEVEPMPTNSLWNSLGALKEKTTELGKAGALSLLVESLLFYILFLLPVCSFIFQRETGTFLPDMANPEAVAEFTKTFGSCWLMARFPPVDAARWAWVFWMTPWFADRLDEWEASDID